MRTACHYPQINPSRLKPTDSRHLFLQDFLEGRLTVIGVFVSHSDGRFIQIEQAAQTDGGGEEHQVAAAVVDGASRS